jgi:hypothetical protein
MDVKLSEKDEIKQGPPKPRPASQERQGPPKKKPASKEDHSTPEKPKKDE